MKILVLSQYYPPESVPIPAEVARGLAQRGHTVRVLTGYPNYPSGRVFAGYRQRWRAREHDGDVVVHRVPLYADHSQRAAKRMLNYASFGLSSATARRLARGADVVYVYATQMTAALGPWMWRRWGGPPYVLHVQDLWPDSIVGSAMATPRWSAMLERTVSVWCANVYRHAAAVIGIAPTMVSVLAARGVRSDAGALVYNWGDEAARVESTRATPRATTEVVYAGNVGEMQDLDVAVRAAHAAADAGVRLTIVGDGVARAGLEALAADLACDNVAFRDPVPRAEVPAVYADADLGLVTLKDLPVFRATIPSKLQGLLANGMPVITAVEGDVRAFVETEGVGIAAPAGDVAALEEAFRRAAALGPDDLAALRSRAARAYDAHFDRETALTRLEGILERAAAEGAR